MNPEWFACYMLVARLLPGAWSTETGPARFQLDLFRCGVCVGLVDGDSLDAHWRHHIRVGDIIG